MPDHILGCSKRTRKSSKLTTRLPSSIDDAVTACVKVLSNIISVSGWTQSVAVMKSSQNSMLLKFHKVNENIHINMDYPSMNEQNLPIFMQYVVARVCDVLGDAVDTTSHCHEHTARRWKTVQTDIGTAGDILTMQSVEKEHDISDSVKFAEDLIASINDIKNKLKIDDDTLVARNVTDPVDIIGQVDIIRNKSQRTRFFFGLLRKDCQNIVKEVFLFRTIVGVLLETGSSWEEWDNSMETMTAPLRQKVSTVTARVPVSQDLLEALSRGVVKTGKRSFESRYTGRV